MRVVKIKPTSPGRRGVVKVINPDLYTGRPHSSLVVSKGKNSSGRNNLGRITSWQRGGGHKRLYRIIDWKRIQDSCRAKVIRIEYDPNRTADIALICYENGKKSYILAPKGLKAGMFVQSGPESQIEVGNCLPLQNIPLGTIVHCIELKIGKGAQLARSAGCSAQVLAKEGAHVTLRLRSGEMRKVLSSCRATIGEVGNGSHNLEKLGKAGASRWRNRRPKVRGVAMNPVDHPLGGGEGRSSGGRSPCNAWGLREGVKTRRNKRTDYLIVRKRRGRKDK